MVNVIDYINPATNLNALLFLKVLAAAFLGGLIGWTRSKYSKIGGSRTFSLVCMGSTLYTLVSIHGFTAVSSGVVDVSRVAAQIIAGVGFIGAGIIWKQEKTIVGLTTAAGIWVSAAIGMAIAVNMWSLAIFGSILSYVIFKMKPFLRKFKRKIHVKEALPTQRSP